jgi:hypothetical protein
MFEGGGDFFLFAINIKHVLPHFFCCGSLATGVP